MPYIGNKLKALRDAKNIKTQQELSDKSGIPLETIRALEQNKRSPRPKLSDKICQFFNISQAELYGAAPAPIEIKPVKIPVVSMAKGDDVEGFEFEALEPYEYEYIDFTGCKAVKIKGNSMAPLAYDNQKVIYSEEGSVKDGDLVFVKIKGKGEYFKRYHKDAKNSTATFLSINVASHGPIFCTAKDIEFMYKVVGVKF